MEPSLFPLVKFLHTNSYNNTFSLRRAIVCMCQGKATRYQQLSSYFILKLSSYPPCILYIVLEARGFAILKYIVG